MPIKIDDEHVILVETIKKDTIFDLLRFESENKNMYKKFGIKSNNLDKIAEALTKLISSNIYANILGYMERVLEEQENKEEE